MQTPTNNARYLSKRSSSGGVRPSSKAMRKGHGSFPALTANFVDRMFGNLRGTGQEAKEPGLRETLPTSNLNLEPTK